jgi:hypothetical protein
MRLPHRHPSRRLSDLLVASNDDRVQQQLAARHLRFALGVDKVLRLHFRLVVSLHQLRAKVLQADRCRQRVPHAAPCSSHRGAEKKHEKGKKKKEKKFVFSFSLGLVRYQFR